MITYVLDNAVDVDLDTSDYFLDENALRLIVAEIVALLIVRVEEDEVIDHIHEIDEVVHASGEHLRRAVRGLNYKRKRDLLLLELRNYLV